MNGVGVEAARNIRSAIWTWIVKPTVCLFVTYTVAYTYGRDDGNGGIVPEYLFFEELELTITRL